MANLEIAVATRNKHRKVPVSHEVIELTDTDSDYAAEEQLLRSRKRPRNGHSAHSSPSQLAPHGRRHFRPRSPAHVMGPSTINAITPRSTRNSVRRLNEQDRKRKGKAVVNRGMLTSNDETDLGESDQDADRSDESSPSRDRHHGRVCESCLVASFVFQVALVPDKPWLIHLFHQNPLPFIPISNKRCCVPHPTAPRAVNIQHLLRRRGRRHKHPLH